MEGASLPTAFVRRVHNKNFGLGLAADLSDTLLKSGLVATKFCTS